MNYQIKFQQKTPRAAHRAPANPFVRGIFSAGILWLGALAPGWATPQEIAVADLSAFQNPPASWQIVGGVSARLDQNRAFEVEEGTGVIVNLPSPSNRGKDIFTAFEHGDMDLELEYMMARGSNSGIYLQGRYELQLLDSWGRKDVRFGDNGGVYERWDESKPDGQKGYGGIPPRQNASRAPGLWQTLKISFQAPRFDGNGKKTSNARLLRVELNGAIIHENLELTGPTRGSISAEESPTGPLRIQGDHGPVAFRNIRVVRFDGGRPDGSAGQPERLTRVDPEKMPIVRSFMDVPGVRRATHAVSVSSPSNVHYTYDLNTGSLLQVWRGDFLNARPMWQGRGDGSSRPLGAVRRLEEQEVLTVARVSGDEAWNADPAAAAYRARGYELDAEDQPTFRYEAHGAAFEDALRVLEEGRGVQRILRAENAPGDLHVRLASAPSIREVAAGLYLIGDAGYYIRLDETGGAKARIRNAGGGEELLLPLGDAVTYSVLF